MDEVTPPEESAVPEITDTASPTPSENSEPKLLNAAPQHSEPAFRPAFLDPERSASMPYVDGYTLGDFTEYDESEESDPDVNRSILKPRHKEIARLHALGHTNNEICEKLGYSQSRISILLHNPVIRNEVDRYRNKLYEKDLISALKDLGHLSLEVVEEMLKSKERLSAKVDTAKWVLEKVTGKAKQEVALESNTFAAFMEMQRQMLEMNSASPTLDVTPPSEEGASPVSADTKQPTSRFAKFAEELE